MTMTVTVTNRIGPFLGWLLLGAAVLAGCTSGRDITKEPIANHPSGDTLQVHLIDSRFYRGEFLGLTDTSVVMLVAMTNRTLPGDTGGTDRLPAVVEISLRLARSVELIGSEQTLVSNGGMVAGEKRNELKLYSRYPQGVDSTLVRRLLNAYKQESLIVIDRTDER